MTSQPNPVQSAESGTASDSAPPSSEPWLVLTVADGVAPRPSETEEAGAGESATQRPSGVVLSAPAAAAMAPVLAPPALPVDGPLPVLPITAVSGPPPSEPAAPPPPPPPSVPLAPPPLTSVAAAPVAAPLASSSSGSSPGLPVVPAAPPPSLVSTAALVSGTATPRPLPSFVPGELPPVPPPGEIPGLRRERPRAPLGGGVEAPFPRVSLDSRIISSDPLAELSEDDEDAVTHMGLPVLDTHPPAPMPNAVLASGTAGVAPSLRPLEKRPSEVRPSEARTGDVRAVEFRRAETRAIPRAVAMAAARPAPAKRAAPSGLKSSVPAVAGAVLLGGAVGVLGLVAFGRLGGGAAGPKPAEARTSAVVAAPVVAVPVAQKPVAAPVAVVPAPAAGAAAVRLREVGTLISDSGTASDGARAEFLELAQKPELTLDALALLCRQAGASGPDLLYALWNRLPGGSSGSTLVRQLLAAPEQRQKASPALQSALALSGARACEDYKSALAQVAEHGDQRSEPMLRALEYHDGCGADGNQDCYACLRSSPLLGAALSAVAGRPALVR
jgi:hypothetical protein